MAVNAIKPMGETMKAGLTTEVSSSALAELHSIGQDTTHFSENSSKPEATEKATGILVQVKTFCNKAFDMLIMKPYRWIGRKLGWLSESKLQPGSSEHLIPTRPTAPLPGQDSARKPQAQPVPEPISSTVKPEVLPTGKMSDTVPNESQSRLTASQATQTEAPQKFPLEKPELEPDWFGFHMRYEDSHGQLSEKITRLHQRASKMPTLLATKPGELRNLSQQYQMLYMPMNRDKELIFDLSELGKTGQRSRAEIANTQQAVELRASLAGKQHFINRARTLLNEFQSYQQQYGQGWRGLIYGLSRQDRQILGEIEQKLNYYETTVQALSQALQPSK